MLKIKAHRGYGKIYAWYMQVASKLSYYLFSGGKGFSEIILDIVDFADKRSILDIGCGVGNLLVDIKSRLAGKDNKILLIGADYSREMIKIAVRKFEEDTKPLFIICDAAKLPFKNNSFDICFNVLLLHHLAASVKKEVLSESARILCPGGVCMLMDIDKPTTILGWLIALTRWHVSTIRENFLQGLEQIYLHVGLHPTTHLKKLGIFSYYVLVK